MRSSTGSSPRTLRRRPRGRTPGRSSPTVGTGTSGGIAGAGQRSCKAGLQPSDNASDGTWGAQDRAQGSVAGIERRACRDDVAAGLSEEPPQPLWALPSLAVLSNPTASLPLSEDRSGEEPPRGPCARGGDRCRAPPRVTGCRRGQPRGAGDRRLEVALARWSRRGTAATDRAACRRGARDNLAAAPTRPVRRPPSLPPQGRRRSRGEASGSP